MVRVFSRRWIVLGIVFPWVALAVVVAVVLYYHRAKWLPPPQAPANRVEGSTLAAAATRSADPEPLIVPAWKRDTRPVDTRPVTARPVFPSIPWPCPAARLPMPPTVPSGKLPMPPAVPSGNTSAGTPPPVAPAAPVPHPTVARHLPSWSPLRCPIHCAGSGLRRNRSRPDRRPRQRWPGT